MPQSAGGKCITFKITRAQQLLFADALLQFTVQPELFQHEIPQCICRLTITRRKLRSFAERLKRQSVQAGQQLDIPGCNPLVACLQQLAVYDFQPDLLGVCGSLAIHGQIAVFKLGCRFHPPNFA